MSLQMFTKVMLHPRIYGAYTELFAGLSPSVTVEKTGQWSMPARFCESLGGGC